QLEAGHEALARGELVEPRRELAWAGAAEVVDPVVAVRRDLQLTQPAEDDRRGRIHVHRPEIGVGRLAHVSIAGGAPLTLLPGGTPRDRERRSAAEGALERHVTRWRPRGSCGGLPPTVQRRAWRAAPARSRSRTPTRA